MSTTAIENRTSPHYGLIFAVLAIFTALEAATAYLPSLPNAVKIGVLIFLAVVKITLVALYFMHLRFDRRFFALPFSLGLVLAVPLVLAISLTARLAPETTQSAAVNEAGQVVDVSEVSYHITAPTTAQAGPITFHVVNNASNVLHEFIIIQTDAPAGELPTNENGRVIEDAVTIIAAADDIAPSQGRNLSVNLAAGHYVLICNLPGGHYLQGMRVDFTVTGTSNVPASTPESPAAEP